MTYNLTKNVTLPQLFLTYFAKTSHFSDLSINFLLDRNGLKFDFNQSISKDVLNKKDVSSVKWRVLAHLKSQPCGQNFQAQI